VSPTPRKPRKKPDDAESAAADVEVAEQEATAEAEETSKPKRARRKAAPKAEATEAKAEAEPKAEATPKAAAKKPAAKAEPEAAEEAAEEPAAEVAAEEPVAEVAAEAPAKPPRRTRRAKADEAPVDPLPEAAPKRAPRDPNTGPPMVRAHAKYVRTSARKARLVCDHIRGKSVEEARAILVHANRDVARDWMKLLESAVANAEHNHELVGDDLRIAAVKADEGPTLKRFRPRAMGRATQIRKRTSHLTITLTPKDGEY
jgi:ribosomal protein L22